MSKKTVKRKPIVAQWTTSFGTPDKETRDKIRQLARQAKALTGERQDEIVVNALRQYIRSHQKGGSAVKTPVSAGAGAS